MPLTCNWHGCTAATICKGAREEEDGNQIVEEYECGNNHTFHETVEL